MNTAMQRLCVWSGVTLLVLFGAGLLIAGFVPPPAPGMNAEEIARLYLDNHARIQAGMVVLLIGTTFWMPWQVVLTLQIRRMELGFGPLSLINLTAGALGVIVVGLPPVLWLAAAFRPETRSAETIQVLHDVGCLIFVGMASFVLIQNLAIGIAILRDRAVPRVLPRWAGYLNLWTVPLLVPGFAVYVFRSGPLAWNGIFTWWVPVAAFGGWFVVMLALMFKAVAAQASAPSEAPLPVG
ncbi:MAG TPA: hypothetical protein VL595_01925 [Pseudonocardia sp.]|nr:hypothetical protein [Pseudonocardia sp.]